MSLTKTKEKFLKEGKETENKFSELFEKFKFASKKADCNEHWDLEINYKVDVKGLKKVRRSDSEKNENYHWVEIKNVQGKNGWLYGEADFFAFELKNFWVIVSKESLQERIAEKTQKVYTKKPEEYKLYQRKGRKDVITLVPSFDLCYICSKIIEKKNEH